MALFRAAKKSLKIHIDDPIYNDPPQMITSHKSPHSELQVGIKTDLFDKKTDPKWPVVICTEF
jgi:hypothetical protein